MYRLLIIAALTAIAAGCRADRNGAVADEARPGSGGTAAVFGADGRLERPRDYRRWVYVGAPVTPNDMNGGHAAFPEFHSVYVDPAAYDHYLRQGSWPEGTVVLKELVSVGGKAASSGKGYFMGEFIGLEAAVKSAARFPDEPGHWGYFRFTDEDGGAVHREASVLPTGACASCHAAGADDDLVFTQYYPVLRAAKGAGRAPENL
ncbi:MAG: cytochrome P460 family protein [Planctomycetota bacterium]